MDYGCCIYASATTMLKMLDTVHHQGIQLCTGAFRTSPVPSFYVESGEPSFSYKSNKLSIQMYTKLLGMPNTLAHDAVCSSSMDFYASPTSGEAYRDRRLTTNFELWVEIFCVSTRFHVRVPKPCLSVCLYPEKRNPLSFVNISPTLVIDASMEMSSRVLHHGNQKNWIFCSKKFEIEFDLYFDLCQRDEIIQVGLNMHL